MDGAPQPGFAGKVRQSMAGIPPEAETRAATPVRTAVPRIPAAAPSAPPPATGTWQIQVGAFRNTVAAEAHLRGLESGVPELARLTAIHQLRGGLNRVRIGGIEDETAARALCGRILAAGRGCFVVGPAG